VARMANLKCNCGKNGNFIFATENFIKDISLIFVNFYFFCGKNENGIFENPPSIIHVNVIFLI